VKQKTQHPVMQNFNAAIPEQSHQAQGDFHSESEQHTGQEIDVQVSTEIENQAEYQSRGKGKYQPDAKAID